MTLQSLLLKEIMKKKKNENIRHKVTKHYYEDSKTLFQKIAKMMMIMMMMMMMMMRMMMMMMICFRGMDGRRKISSLISSLCHFQRSYPSQISDTSLAGFELVQNLNSGFAACIYAVVTTATLQRRLRFYFVKLYNNQNQKPLVIT